MRSASHRHNHRLECQSHAWINYIISFCLDIPPISHTWTFVSCHKSCKSAGRDSIFRNPILNEIIVLWHHNHLAILCPSHFFCLSRFSSLAMSICVIIAGSVCGLTMVFRAVVFIHFHIVFSPIYLQNRNKLIMKNIETRLIAK